ncbi:cytochrome b [Paraburkholderia dinghuensis]|uniref:Cytochrome B n=1 Tax=Paraburkholderia dinghuensis TaxID=2305225 RepID=A0A3N6MSJ5_9BURK|nr:cytochrome b/b6 domain-containing protein [Paraburkholderia dinghuensis]RQH06934.1 cytochrome B [Paraburkholderia dinghuensis]
MLTNRHIPRYDRFTRYLHWAVATGIIYASIVGYSLNYISSPGVHNFFSVLNMSLATVVTVLMCGRFVWRFFRPSINKPGQVPAKRNSAANFAHEVFYIIIFTVLISGFLMLKHGYNFFGLFYVPRPIAVNDVNDFFFKIHRYSTATLVIMLFLHVLAVVKCHIIDRHPIISRMI